MFLGNVRVFCCVVDVFVQFWVGFKVDQIVGIEVCGFILGGVVVYQLFVGFVLICKKGKLLYEIVWIVYLFEYGFDEMEMYKDVIQVGDRVILVDDLIVIGGMVEVVCKFLRFMGVNIEVVCFIVDFLDLGGCKKLEVLNVFVCILVEFLGY